MASAWEFKSLLPHVDEEAKIRSLGIHPSGQDEPEWDERVQAAEDARILLAAAKLIDKYYHPSRLGQVPGPQLADMLNEAKILLRVTASKITSDEG